VAHNQQQRRVHCRLRIVALHEAIGALHDARLWIGEVVLILAGRLGLAGLVSRSGRYAKIMCSAVFITGLDPEFAAENVGYFTSPYAERAKVAKPVIDGQNKAVQFKLPNGVTRTAK